MLTAADVMTREVVSVGPDTPVRAIAELLFTRRISGVPVLEDGRLIGVVSEGDLIGHAAATGEQRRSWWLSALMNDSASARDYAKTHGRTARDVMTSAVITIGEAATLAEIAKTLERHRIKRVPVLREGKLVGIVSRGNLLQALATLEVEAAGTVDDDAIRERLIAELRGQSWAHLPPDAIVVENGIVRLSGIVQTEDERRALRIAAENTPGVKGLMTTSRFGLLHRSEGRPTSSGIYCRPLATGRGSRGQTSRPSSVFSGVEAERPLWGSASPLAMTVFRAMRR